MMFPTMSGKPDEAGTVPGDNPGTSGAVFHEVLPPDAALMKILPLVKPLPDLVYAVSCFVLPFEHRGKSYAFNTLTRQCLEAEIPASAKAGEGFDALIGRRFLVPENQDECASYLAISSLMRTYTRKKGIGTYTVMPTLGCNARCFYCYQDGMTQVSMSLETVDQTIRFILSTHAGNRVALEWFGGEPLLRTDVIDRVCAAVREDGTELVSSMVSNGSLITKDIIRKMTEDWQLKKIQISMDGAEEDYLYRKRYVRGENPYRRVMEAVSAMSEAGISVAVRCNVDGENWDRIPRFLEELGRGVAHKECVSVYFCPLNAVRLSEEDLVLWEKIREAGPLIKAAGFKASRFMEPAGCFRITHCMADYGGVVIGPDGCLYACEHCSPESRLGDIWQGAADERARKAFCRTGSVREKCHRCPFLPDCTSFSGCPVEDTHCREVRKLMTLDYLCRVLDGKAGPEQDEEIRLDC